MTTHAAIHHDPRAAELSLKAAEEERRHDRDLVRNRHNLLHVAGRMLVAAVFLVGGIAKLVNFAPTRDALANAGLPIAGTLLAIAVLVEVVGGLFLVSGFKVREASVALSVYLVAVTLLLLGDFSVEANRASALLNLAIVGGLLGLYAHGSGMFSADVAYARYTAKKYGL